MKTIEEHALTHTRKTIFYKVDDISELVETIEVDYLVEQLKLLQTKYPTKKLLMRTDTDYDCSFVSVEIGYFDLEPIEEFQSRVLFSYQNYVYHEKQQMEMRLAKGHWG